MIQAGRPHPSEYPSRYQRYIDLVPEHDVILALETQSKKTISLLENVDELMSSRRYEKDKWSIKEVVGHLIDVERIFSLRVVRFSRNDTKARIDYNIDKDDYVRRAAYHLRPWSNICQEFELLRKANLLLFRSLELGMFVLFGVAGNASGEDRLSVRGVLYTMLGHERHHLAMIRQKYLGEMNP